MSFSPSLKEIQKEAKLFMSKMPEGATHRHGGNTDFRPHYIKVEDKTYTWVTGLVFGDSWSDIPAHDDLGNYEAL